MFQINILPNCATSLQELYADNNNTETFQNKIELLNYMAMHFSRNTLSLFPTRVFPIFHFLFVMIHKIIFICPN